MYVLAPQVSIKLTSYMHLCTSCTLVGTLIALIASTLDNWGLTPLLLTYKSRYSVFVRPNNDFSALTINPRRKA